MLYYSNKPVKTPAAENKKPPRGRGTAGTFPAYFC